MKALIVNTDKKRTELEFKVRNGYLSFTSSTTEYKEMAWEEMKDLCSSYVEDLYSVENFRDNPNNSFNDFVERELHNLMYILDCEDFEYTDNGCSFWEFTSGGQCQDDMPTEIVELWDKYHLKEVTDDNKHIIDAVETLLAELEANVCEQ